MRIGLAQINCQIGAFEQNFEKILDFTKKAKERRCDLVVFPELALFGYWPSDLLEQKNLVAQQLKKLEELRKKIPQGIAALVGAVTLSPKKSIKHYHNSVVLIQKGKKSQFFHKELLPNYDVFDETRHFSPGKLEENIFNFKGKKILVTICEDIWAGGGDSWTGTHYPKDPIDKFKNSKIDLVINASASPFSIAKDKRRKEVVKKVARITKAPVVYTNLVAGQDELIFDGGSFAVDQKGKLLAQSIFFNEDLNIVDLEKNQGGIRELKENPTDILREALVLGLRDFVNKSEMEQVHLGLSGGVDSALVACLAVDALGPQKVVTFAMPGPYSSAESLKLAKELAKNLGCEFKSVSINESYETVLTSLQSMLGYADFGLMNENLQSRLRGLFLNAYSNLKKSLLLATGNKDEFAVGYATLYGDMCGGLAPIGDLLKGQVYDLCKLYNSQSELIPSAIITRAPTAELRPNQKDSDSLPEYNILDPMIQNFIVDLKPPKTKLENEILNKILKSEFKRWQAPPILRVTNHSFGSGRRYPLTNKK